MDLFLVIIVVLALVVVSSLLQKLVPQVSLPLFQIALGVLFGFFPLSHQFDLDAEMFLLIFVAPLLFMDSKHVQNKELWKNKGPILLLALALVFITVLIVGAFISVLIPAMPVAGAFALAAILSPTDPVSVKAIFGKIKIPHRSKIILEGESLINDASGLVVFRFAVAALFTGVFSIWEVSSGFVMVALGGVFVGAGIMLLIMLASKWLRHVGVEDANVFVLLQIMTPFVAFTIAESFHFSGVLAVVSAGVVISYGRSRVAAIQEARTRFVSEGAWSTLLFVLNGFVFALLGMQLPRIVESRFMYDNTAIFLDIGMVFALYASIMLVRFAAVFLAVKPEGLSRVKNSILVTLSGVKGAITLAAGFSIPLMIVSSSGAEIPFHERDLMLFIAGGVIILSILVANVLLPLGFPKRDEGKEKQELSAKGKLYKAAVSQINKDMAEKNMQSGYSLLTHYEELIHERLALKQKGRNLLVRGREKALFMLGLEAELQEMLRLFDDPDCEFSKEALAALIRITEIKLASIREKLVYESRYFRLQTLYENKEHLDDNELVQIKLHTTDVAIKEIMRRATKREFRARRAAIAHFTHKLNSFLSVHECEASREYNREFLEFAEKARLAEKSQLKKLYDNGEIDNATKIRLALDIALEEVSLLEEEYDDVQED